MPWRPLRPEPRGMAHRSWHRQLRPPKPRRPGRRPAVQWQEPARPADDDRYSSFPPLFWCEGSLAVTLLVAWVICDQRLRLVGTRSRLLVEHDLFRKPVSIPHQVRDRNRFSEKIMLHQ